MKLIRNFAILATILVSYSNQIFLFLLLFLVILRSNRKWSDELLRKHPIGT